MTTRVGIIWGGGASVGVHIEKCQTGGKRREGLMRAGNLNRLVRTTSLDLSQPLRIGKEPKDASKCPTYTISRKHLRHRQTAETSCLSSGFSYFRVYVPDQEKTLEHRISSTKITITEINSSLPANENGSKRILSLPKIAFTGRKALLPREGNQASKQHSPRWWRFDVFSRVFAPRSNKASNAVIEKSRQAKLTMLIERG